ncbi:organic solute transporter Ostalpha-domain-containing protein [Daedaleopsis nitida]|nr:organic solute transporter Ostalpha-domain-containing protein [Daedaleopsis nitida]
MAEIHNGRCHAETAPLDSPPLIQNGKINIQYHHIGWIVSSVLTLVAIGVSYWLINKHLLWYTNKHEQRYIVRILFMVPLYAIISTASYLWWNHSTPLLLLRDGYESTVLTAFFYLLLLYLSPDPNEQKEIFRKNGLSRENDTQRRARGEPLQKWMFPLGSVQWKPEDGLYFLQLMKWGVLQYCIVRPATTLAAVILDYAGLYCEDSWGLGWGHIYITLIVSISVTIGMYCLIQIYMVVKEQLASQKPLLKLFAIKAVVFLTFWQATFLSILTLFGIVKDTPYMTADNINIGIGALLETFEMALFACLHIKAFSYKPYRPLGGLPQARWRALVHAMNFAETGRELWSGTVYMFHQYRGREVDSQARRQAALENVFGQSRYAITRETDASGSKVNMSEKNAGVRVQVEKEVRVGEERQWLGVGDNYIYGLGYQSKPQRERSEGLELQIEKELARRGYGMRGMSCSSWFWRCLCPIVDAEAVPPVGHQRTQASWWRRIYNRLSQSGPDLEIEVSSPPTHNGAYPRRRSTSRRRSRDVTGKVAPLMADVQEDDYNDPPPPSAIRTYRESRNKKSRNQGARHKSLPTMEPPLLFTSFGDIPSPLSSPDARNEPCMTIPSALTQAQPRMSQPLLSPSAQSLQADSFLDRAFAASVEPGSSVDMLPSGSTSSQSHHDHVRLVSGPVIDTKAKVLPKTPVIVDPLVPGPSSADLSGMGPSSAGQSQSASPPMPVPVLPFIAPAPPVSFSAAAVVSQQAPNARPAAPTSPPVEHRSLAASPERPSPLATAEDETRGRRRSSHRRDSARFYPEPRNFSPPQPSMQTLPPLQPIEHSPLHSPAQSHPRSPLRSLPQSPQLQRASASYSRGLRRNSGTMQYMYTPQQQQPQHTPPYPPLNRYTPTRDRIILPTPLAPLAGPTSIPPGGAAAGPSGSQCMFSPPGPAVAPPGLAGSPPSRERRWTGTHSPPSSNTGTR